MVEILLMLVILLLALLLGLALLQIWTFSRAAQKREAAQRDENLAQRQEVRAALQQMGDLLGKTLEYQGTAQREQTHQMSLALRDVVGGFERLRETLEFRFKGLVDENNRQMDQIRQTVDEKLQKTLETRLGQSFELVSKRLEEVQKGLGEMQNLAAGVGDLKKVLSNVKTRGILGEYQLAALLEELLAPAQYESNVAIRRGSLDRVEFAVKLPGTSAERALYLPIDAKFPADVYQNLLTAYDNGLPAGIEESRKVLAAQVRAQAQTIRDKYVVPPVTTDFALLFLPFEGLYAEVLRIPGLFEGIQRDLRITVTGPTTLAAFLNSLQMGFRTLAIQQRSGEVWEILGEVKAEFGSFASILENTKTKLEAAAKTIEQAEVRTRAITRKLRDVEGLPSPD